MKKYTWIIIVLVAVISVLALWGWDKDPASPNGSEDTTVADATTDTTGAVDTTGVADTTSVIVDTTVAPDTGIRTEVEHTTVTPETTEDETTASPDITEAPETTEVVTPETTEEEKSEVPETTLAPETTKSPETTETVAPETTAPIVEINENTAVIIAKDYLGEKDPDTGYTYSYQYVETTAEGNYKIRVSWYLEEDDRYATCGYLIVTPKGEVTKFDW